MVDSFKDVGDGLVIVGPALFRRPFKNLWYVVYYQTMGFISDLHIRIFGVGLRFGEGTIIRIKFCKAWLGHTAVLLALDNCSGDSLGVFYSSFGFVGFTPNSLCWQLGTMSTSAFYKGGQTRSRTVLRTIVLSLTTFVFLLMPGNKWKRVPENCPENVGRKDGTASSSSGERDGSPRQVGPDPLNHFFTQTK